MASKLSCPKPSWLQDMGNHDTECLQATIRGRGPSQGLHSRAWRQLSQESVNVAVPEFRPRLRAWAQYYGGHFEQFFRVWLRKWKKKTLFFLVVGVISVTLYVIQGILAQAPVQFWIRGCPLLLARSESTSVFQEPTNEFCYNFACMYSFDVLLSP